MCANQRQRLTRTLCKPVHDSWDGKIYVTDRVAKQVIVMRKDLGMRKGKMIAQGAHAAMAVLLEHARASETELVIPLDGPAHQWLVSGRFTKVCVSVDSEAALEPQRKPVLFNTFEVEVRMARRRHAGNCDAAAAADRRGPNPKLASPSPEQPRCGASQRDLHGFTRLQPGLGQSARMSPD